MYNTVQDSSAIKSKAFSLGAIMRNKKLSQEMIDAWNSPVGSTKRNRAKSILLSLQKTRKNYDGAGGSGGFSLPQNTEYMVAGQSGQIIPGSDRGFVNYISQQNLQPEIQQSQTGMVTEKTAQPQYSPRILSGGFDLSKIIKKPTGTTQPLSLDESGRIMSEEDAFIKSITQPTIKTAPKATIPEQVSGAIASPPLGYSTMYKPDGTMKSDKELRAEGYTTPTISDQELLDQAASLYDSGNIDAIDQWYGNLSPTLKNKYSEIYQAIQSGVPKTSFFYQLMQDRKAASELSGIPEEFIPAGISLTQSIKEEKDRLKKEYKINSQMSNLIQSLNAGVNIKNDLSSYIKSKDEYLGHIDGMIDKAKETMSYTDMSNPYVANRMQNYMNYLNILSGRQNQRYVDFLKNATDSYDAKIKGMQNTLTLSLDQLENEMSDIKPMMEEDYNRIKETIYGLYDSVKEINNMSRDETKLKYDILESQLDIEKKILEIQKLASNTIPKTYDEFLMLVKEETGKEFSPDNPAVKAMYQDYLNDMKKETSIVITAGDYFSDDAIAKGATKAKMSNSEFRNLSIDEASKYIYSYSNIINRFEE